MRISATFARRAGLAMLLAGAGLFVVGLTTPAQANPAGYGGSPCATVYHGDHKTCVTHKPTPSHSHTSPTPSHSTSTSPTPSHSTSTSPSISPSVSTSPSAVVTVTETPVGGGSLAVTPANYDQGQLTGTLAAGAVLVAFGLGLFVWGRRRNRTE